MTKRTARDYQDCARAGMTHSEAARHLGVQYGAVYTMSRIHNLKFKPAKMGRPANASKDGEAPRVAIVKALRAPMVTSSLCAATGLSQKQVLYNIGVLRRMKLVRVADRIGKETVWAAQ